MADTSELKPALTPEEWRGGEFVRQHADGRTGAMVGGAGYQQLVPFGDAFFQANSRHALAALSLHGQPFGFTWDDVDNSRLLIDNLDRGEFNDRQYFRLNEWLRDLADRIAALLPPRETNVNDQPTRYLTCPTCFDEPLQIFEYPKGQYSCITCQTKQSFLFIPYESHTLRPENDGSR